MTYPKIKPCPKCGSDSLSVYKYDHGGRRVECSMLCGYMGPACTSIGWAIKHHNAEREGHARAFLAKLEGR